MNISSVRFSRFLLKIGILDLCGWLDMGRKELAECLGDEDSRCVNNT